MRTTRVFTSIDTHTCGQPTRTITGGITYIPGATIVEKMTHLK
jgi:proline racemase